METTIISAVSSTSLVESATVMKDCLFGLISSPAVCSYSLLNPISYFSLGDAIAAFGLIFAVYQLRTRDWKIVMRIRNVWERNLIWIFGGTGLCLVGLATLIAQVPTNFLTAPFNYPVLYEFLAFLFFIASPTSLFVLANKKKNLFTTKRAETFYQVLLGEVSRPSDENIEACVNIIGSNLDVITEAVTKRKWSPRDKAGSLNEEELYAEYAYAIYDVLLSEPKIVNYLVTARLDFLLHFFSVLKDGKVTRYHASLAVEKIIDGLYENTQSHLYTQYDRRGLALVANIYEFVFADPHIVDEYSIFSNALPWSRRSVITDKQLNIFLETFEYAIKSYWDNPEKWRSVSSLRQGFRELEEYVQSLAYSTDKFRRDGKKEQFDEAFDKLRLIDNFLSSSYVHPFLEACKNNKVPKNEMDANEIDDYQGSLNAAYAKTLYSFFESMAVLDESDDDIYHSLVDIIHALDHNEMAEVRNKFFKRIWKQIEENEKRYFPVVARPYLNVMGIQVSPIPAAGWRKEEGEKLVALLERLKPRIKNKEKMVNDKLIEEEFLPKGVYFDHTTEEFVYVMGFGRGPKKVFGTDKEVKT